MSWRSHLETLSFRSSLALVIMKTGGDVAVAVSKMDSSTISCLANEVLKNQQLREACVAMIPGLLGRRQEFSVGPVPLDALCAHAYLRDDADRTLWTSNGVPDGVFPSGDSSRMVLVLNLIVSSKDLF